MISEIEVLVDQKALNGEGPSWDVKHSLLYWIDIFRATIFLYDPHTRKNQAYDLSASFETIGTVAPCARGGVIFAPDRKIAHYDFSTQKVTILAEVEPDKPEHRFNDGKCDPHGRFMAGTMRKEPNGTYPGALYSLEKNGKVSKLLDGLGISNGLGWSPDYRTFYLADSYSRDVWAFDYDLETGKISRQRVAFTIQEGEAVADGLTTDQEGMVWLALWDGACVQRWNPRSGELLGTYPFPAKRTSCPVFGGEEMNEFYVTSASVGLTDEDWQAYPHNGALMRVKTEFTGMPSFTFGG